jgi:hypothetical protein
MRFYRVVALSNAVAFARFGREKKSALLLSSWYRARGGSGQYRSFRIERKARREEKRGRAATIRGVEKTVCVAHVSRSRFRLVMLLDEFADHRDVLATALTRFARRSAPLSRADDF